MARDGGISQEAREAAYEQTARALQVYFDANPARPFIDGYFDRVGAWAARNSIPRHRILLGEFGALRSDARHIAAAAPDRARYVRDVREAAEAGGFGWAFWNLFDGMGLMDDATRAFDPAMIAALGLAMPKP